MTAIVPDSLQGALLVSVIDFFLSFLIISGIGFVLSAFPLLNRMADAFNALGARVQTGHRPEQKAHAPSDGASVLPAAPDHAPAAAVDNSAMGGKTDRVLSLAPSSRSKAWVDEGRIALLDSHNFLGKKAKRVARAF